MLIPPFLSSGDTIGICATARKIDKEVLEPAIEILKGWGLTVVLSSNIYSCDNQYAGTDYQRAQGLQELINREDVNAIIVARGGYGTVRIIDQINFDPLKTRPKWICGYSDVTVLHSHLCTQHQMATLHCTMPVNFKLNEEALESLRKALFGEELRYLIPTDLGNKNGKAHGKIIGGNLSLLYALAASISDIETSGKILFIEDLDEYLYHVDRMMIQLKRSGKLKNLAGLIVGGFTDMKDNTVPFGKNAYQIIADAVKEYHFPVCFNFPAGHQELNKAIYFGLDAVLDVSEQEVKLYYPHILS